MVSLAPGFVQIRTSDYFLYIGCDDGALYGTCSAMFRMHACMRMQCATASCSSHKGMHSCQRHASFRSIPHDRKLIFICFKTDLQRLRVPG